ncbi:MAG: hypothetical protein LUD39_01065 [Opitutae bacterium]|nr:hypothetical protein [Opitutae bacterium]MCD8298337.1 hypothetical protein [Opitutae bacterium]
MGTCAKIFVLADFFNAPATKKSLPEFVIPAATQPKSAQNIYDNASSKTDFD